jgi:hypothetical protein
LRKSDEAVFRLRCAVAAFCLGFAFSMLCLSACIRSVLAVVLLVHLALTAFDIVLEFPLFLIKDIIVILFH